MKTALELWTEQLDECAGSIAELQRIQKVGTPRQKLEAKAWIEQYHKGYLLDSVVAIMKHSGLAIEDVSDRFEQWDNIEDRLILTLND